MICTVVKNGQGGGCVRGEDLFDDVMAKKATSPYDKNIVRYQSSRVKALLKQRKWFFRIHNLSFSRHARHGPAFSWWMHQFGLSGR